MAAREHGIAVGQPPPVDAVAAPARSAHPGDDPGVKLLGARAIRELADRLGLRPTKTWGQNFVVDANTVRRIARLAEVGPRDSILEVGPGLGSLTLALLPLAGRVDAVEIDPALAAQLPLTVAQRAPAYRDRLRVHAGDALELRDLTGAGPTAFVANLPYNVAVPVLLTVLTRFPTIELALVMVQLEVAERLAAAPGSRAYGVPSAKAAWYGDLRLVGTVPRAVFWPEPNVDSGLVALHRRPQPVTSASREEVFAVVDAAFAQRRKTLRAALSGFAGSATRAEDALRAAGIDPRSRGEQLDIRAFARLAEALPPRVTS